MLARTLLRRLARRPLQRAYSAKPPNAPPAPLERLSDPRPDTASYRELQKSKPLNPHLTNRTSTNDPATHIPHVGVANAPPELISSVEAISGEPPNLHAMTGEKVTSSTSEYLSRNGPGPGLAGSFGGQTELGVGEMAEAKFRIEPLRRTGEDLSTMRARLLYQSRKRGILETDLLLSTFADANLHNMTPPQLQQYDLFLDENDWDIYYWTTQHAPPTSAEYAEGGAPSLSTPTAAGTAQSARQHAAAEKTSARDTTSEKGKEADAAAAEAAGQFGEGPVGEWAQTVGRVKEPYRPPPSRWRDSEILGMLRAHVKKRAQGGESVGGLGRMPDVRQF